MVIGTNEIKNHKHKQAAFHNCNQKIINKSRGSKIAEHVGAENLVKKADEQTQYERKPKNRQFLSLYHSVSNH
jgi:hypothetical protein